MNAHVTKVYKFRRHDGFEWLLPVNSDDFERLVFDGRLRSSTWKPVKMKRLKVSDEGRRLKPSDFPACSGGEMLMISRAAKEKVGARLEQYGELLPLACDDGEFWTLNVTCFVDALDESRSKLSRGSDTGRILIILNHVFIPTRLGQADVFKLPQFPRGTIFVTSPFVELVRNSGLSGLDFVQVWAPN